ncbi:MAG TPA: cyclic nucleotide-binding domain-containing protein [Actinomycetota bacterium]|nr:cyclic nucleotide-binding domain-containing protein [Actinomycetota bacterium]
MDAKRLKSIPLFADLSDHERGQVARWADEVEVPPGRHLADQGEFAYEFFVIEEGSAEVTKDGEHLTDLGTGDFFGEIALLEADRRTATVTASSPMRLIVMHGRDFREMASEMPHVAEKIRAAIRERTQS